MSANFDKDKDLAGYMYLFDSDQMEEELRFEELLTRVGLGFTRKLLA